jgi:hypothetical protein
MDTEETMPEEKTYTAEFEVNGEEVLTKIKELAHEGNIRRVIIRNEEGRNLIDVPLTFGIVGALLVPQLAAIGAIAALLSHGSILVEKVKEE